MAVVQNIFRRVWSVARFQNRNFNRTYLILSSNRSCAYRYTCHYPLLLDINGCQTSSICLRKFTNTSENNAAKPPGIVARFKQMYKDYWYVLVPVHLVTSICWFGSFYYLAKSGVDIVALLKSIGLSDKLVDPLKDSSMGYFALAYALYKVATPLRYTVTLGGTTISIKHLKNWGYIKPMPSREQLKELYQTKKENIQGMYEETRQELRQRKDLMKDRKENVMGDIARYKQEINEIKKSELKNKTPNEETK